MLKPKGKIFIRKDSRKGIYTATIEGKEIRITDNEFFGTEDQKQIDFLVKDFEIVEYIPDRYDYDDEPKKYEDMTAQELQRQLVDMMHFKSRKESEKYSKKDCLKILEKLEKENSDPKNDQGENK